METKVIQITAVENLLDDRGDIIGRTVTDHNGNDIRVKKGAKGAGLWERWPEIDAGVGKWLEFSMAQFKAGDGNTYPYVADFRWVEDGIPPAVEPVKVETPDVPSKPVAKAKTRDESIRESMDAKAREIRRDIVYKFLHEHIMAKTLTLCFEADPAKVLLEAYKDFILKNL